MKDRLFEMLMDFFEKTLTQIKEAHPETAVSTNHFSDNPTQHDEDQAAHSIREMLRTPNPKSIRVFTLEEQFKFTKASYQFIIRLMRLGIIANDAMEDIIHQLLFSDSIFVTLQETKWAIRNTLADRLNTKQLAFLDLVLYQKEDQLPLQ